MSEKPKVGEWWVNKFGKRMYVAGTTADGKFVLEFPSGGVYIDHGDWTECRRLIGCTGWEWIEDTFPQWLTFNGDRFADCAYLFRESREITWSVNRDGTRKKMNHTIEPISQNWVRTRQDLAEALVDQKPEVKPEMNPRELEFLEIVARQRDTIDKLSKRLEKVEQSNFMHQVIGGTIQ